MGRHAGWIAAAGGPRRRKAGRAAAHHPVPGDRRSTSEQFLARVKQCVDRLRLLRDRRLRGRRSTPDGKFLAEAGTKDAFGHTQLGGVGPGGRQHGARGARLQVPLGGGRLPAARRAPHRLEGRRRAGLRGRQGGGRARGQGRERRDAGHRAQVRQALPLEASATCRSPRSRTRRRRCRASSSRADGFGITAACRRYLEPLIAGEDYPPYKHGLPDYVRIRGVPVRRKLKGDFKL